MSSAGQGGGDVSPEWETFFFLQLCYCGLPADEMEAAPHELRFHSFPHAEGQ